MPTTPVIDDDGSEVGAYCFGYSPGRRPTRTYTQAELWAIYCDGRYPASGGGDTVTILRDRNATPEDIINNGLDPTGTYGRYTIRCQRGTAPLGSLTYFLYWEDTAPVPLEVLRAAARERIDPPDPVVGANPPHDEADRFGIVGIPTWFWVEEWDPIGPESETSGLITVEVMAFPRKVTWDLGDGKELVCEDPPVPWAPGLPDASTDCLYTYPSSSADLAGERYELSATIEWYFEWWVNGAPQGEFESFESDTPFFYQVGEIQAVESD